MQRIIEIKNRLEVIGKLLDAQYPRFKADPGISVRVADLKDHVEAELGRIRNQLKQGKLTEFEVKFIEPAINDIHLTSLARIRRGSKPSDKLNRYICDTSFTISHWLGQIQEYQDQNVKD